MHTPEQIARFSQLPLSVESELGRCSMSVREVLSLAPGSLVKLTRPIGGKVDLFVGGAPFGAGEMLRIGGTIAVKITGFVNQNPD
jgi:flagellar motor switch protein FliN